MSTGLSGVPLAITPLNRKEFVSDQEVRWCPGCGDYAVLAAFQSLMPQLGVKRENTVVVSGIGCSSRFPYYLDTYGMHSIHGRAPAIATMAEIDIDISQTASTSVRDLKLETVEIVVSLGVHKLGVNRSQMALSWDVPEFEPAKDRPALPALREIRDGLATRIRALGAILTSAGRA